MRVGIDARILGHPRSGIGVYVENLVEQFLRLQGLEIALFGDRPVHAEYAKTAERVKTVIFGHQHRKRWSQFYLPGELKRHKIDIYHATWNAAVPVLTAVPSVLTVHDLIPLAVPGYFTKIRKRCKYILLTRSAVKKAKAIITDAECTKVDLIKYFNTPKEKINVIHLGIDESSKYNDQDANLILNKFGIEKDYIVNIGSFDKRRNADTLIKAFNRFIKNSNVNCRLVLIGGYNNFPDEIKRFNAIISDLGLTGNVIFTNYVSQKEMFVLLSNARVMVHLSLYEGFCFPVLEAMAADVPVIALNTGSIPEVAGDAAMLVDPNDETAAASAMERLWRDKALTEDLIKKGAARIKEFSWQKTAEDTINIYREVLGGKIS